MEQPHAFYLDSEYKIKQGDCGVYDDIGMNACVLYLKKNSLGTGKGHHMDTTGITAESFNISTSSRVGT